MKQCLLRKVIWNDETNALTVAESSLNYIKSTKCVKCIHYYEEHDTCEHERIDVSLMTECCKSHCFECHTGREQDERVMEQLDYEWLFCQNCKLFDGYDICMQNDNFGTVTEHTINKCIEKKYFTNNK